MLETIKNTVKPRKGFDDIIGVFEESDGPGNHRCLWDKSVCTESVTHQITFGLVRLGEEDGAVAQTYCARHYAIELAHFVEFHSSRCPVTIDKHLRDFGALDS
ncbi:hypothetical protein ACTXI4_08970 [Glutamicibacter ardleyensis]|uniref:hypothetical protein n=1 Tax=Glutamicibacter ardleyensis TaxID=225894 RepID=UPI003F9BDF62